MGSEPFGPFAIEPAWRRRGPTAEPFSIEGAPADLPVPVPVRASATPVSRAAAVSQDAQTATFLEASGSAAPPAAPAAEAVPPPQSALPEPDEPELIAPVKVNPPPPEDVPAPSPFKPDPEPALPSGRRRARRRPGLRVEKAIPYLAAIVGLVALGGAIWLDRQNQERFAAISTELVALKGAVQQAMAAAETPPPPQPAADDGTIDALLALQNRIAALEQAASAALPVDPEATGSVPDATRGPGQPAEPLRTQLADGPTKDCIPLGTRFVMMVGDSYPICRTPEVIKLADVNMEGVILEGGKAVMAGSTSALKFGECALAVLTTDMNGFAELEVTCR